MSDDVANEGKELLPEVAVIAAGTGHCLKVAGVGGAASECCAVVRSPLGTFLVAAVRGEAHRKEEVDRHHHPCKAKAK